MLLKIVGEFLCEQVFFWEEYASFPGLWGIGSSESIQKEIVVNRSLLLQGELGKRIQLGLVWKQRGLVLRALSLWGWHARDEQVTRVLSLCASPRCHCLRAGPGTRH